MNVLRMADQDLAGKRVLIREDLNVPVEGGKVTSDARIRASLPTIKLALEKGAKVFVTSHLGRPEEGVYAEEFSLAPVATRLSELLGKPVPLRKDADMPALNLRYLSSIILIDGRLDFVDAQSLDRMHGDPAVAARMATVDVVHDPDQESGPGRERTESARVTLTLRSGQSVERFVPHVVGFPSHPMDRDEVEAKAVELVRGIEGVSSVNDNLRIAAEGAR